MLTARGALRSRAHRIMRGRCAALMLCVLSALGDPADAQACPPLASVRPPRAALVPHYVMIPAGGDIAIACANPCVPTEDPIRVVDWTTGLPLSGDMIRSGLNAEGLPWFVFRPTIPLVENQGVSVKIQTEGSDGGLEGEDFMAMAPDGELDPLDVEFAANPSSTQEPVGPEVCCAETACSNPGLCFYEKVFVRPALKLYVRTQTVAAEAGLFHAASARSRNTSGSGPFLFWGRAACLEPGDARYCYTLQAEPPSRAVRRSSSPKGARSQRERGLRRAVGIAQLRAELGVVPGTTRGLRATLVRGAPGSAQTNGTQRVRFARSNRQETPWMRVQASRSPTQGCPRPGRVTLLRQALACTRRSRVVRVLAFRY